jgi:tRNA (cytidine/uridine-2'-O-)-methyltransferase
LKHTVELSNGKFETMNMCLFDPEIPQNAGTLARLASCTDMTLHIIEPASFILSDKKFLRAGMDYIDITRIVRHDSFEKFRKFHNGRIILLDTKAVRSYNSLKYEETDCLMVGKESTGVPFEIFQSCDETVVIHMKHGCRSLNVAVAMAMVVGYAFGTHICQSCH